MRKLSRLLVVLGVAVSAACERVVDVDINAGPTRLVVEARLERVVSAPARGDQSVKLSTTTPYFSGVAAPAARGAIVRITDNLGTVTTLAESATAGVYTTNSLVVERGRTYTLTVDYEGQRYEGVESTRAVPRIDSLYFDSAKPGRFSDGKGVRATIDLFDPGSERNFYLWDLYVNGVRQLGPDSTFKQRIIAPDDALNGETIKGFQPFDGIPIEVGATVLMRQIALSDPMYRYFYALSDQVSGDASIFAVPPASIHGNVANKTTPGRPALGYFYVAEVAEARAVRLR